MEFLIPLFTLLLLSYSLSVLSLLYVYLFPTKTANAIPKEVSGGSAFSDFSDTTETQAGLIAGVPQ